MNERILNMEFQTIYRLYLNKVIKKNRTKEELDIVIFWLTGYDEESLTNALNKSVNVKDFYSNYPKLNENANLITGSICGCKIENITNPLEKNIKLLDKLVDELAKGKSLDKILRK